MFLAYFLSLMLCSLSIAYSDAIYKMKFIARPLPVFDRGLDCFH